MSIKRRGQTTEQGKITFYKLTFVGSVDDQGRPVVAPIAGRPSVRELTIWDDRSLAELTSSYEADRSLTVQRLGTRHAPGRPLEHKGELTVFAPHLISLTIDLKAKFAQPDGPLPFEPRNQ